ncbi:MAG: hypothetical protein AAF748_15650 [Pseudomonadota bacterium]
MRNERDFDDTAIVLVVIGLALMMAVFGSIAAEEARDGLARTPFGVVSSPLVDNGRDVRVGELPQIRR